MNKPAPLEPVLDEANAAFIQHIVSINVAARNADNQPVLSRAYGCRVSDDRRQITIFVYRNTAQQLLDNIQQYGDVAVVFSRPSTHETLQLKARDASLVAFEEADQSYIDRYAAAFVKELLSIGFPESFTHAMIGKHDTELVGICFTPSSAFVATPGPKAGQKINP